MLHASKGGRALKACYWTLCMLAVLLVFAILGARSYLRLRSQAEDLDCRSNLKSIGTVLVNYGEYFGCYFPPFISDQYGHPLYSWRVLLLPSYNLVEAYDAFDFTKPWDDPANLNLCQGKYESLLKLLFSCPTTRNTKAVHADYCYPLNGQDQWPRDFIYDATSGSSFPQILLVESGARNTYWSEPIDIEYHEPGLKGLLAKLRESKAVHESGFKCFVSDGAVVQVLLKGNAEHDLRISRISTRLPTETEGSSREATQRVVERLMTILSDAPFHSQHQALLLLGELGPEAKPATAMIRRVMTEEDVRLHSVAAFALAKIEK